MISTTTSRVAYSGNGVTTAFSFPYYFEDEDDLVVISRITSTGAETVKTITTHYTVSGAGSGSGGTVTMLTAPASGTKLTIYRSPAALQPTDISTNEELPDEDIELALDRLTLIAQRCLNLLSRTPHISEGFADTFDYEIPGPISTYAGYVLGLNDDGDGWTWVSPDEFSEGVADLELGTTAITNASSSIAVTFGVAFSSANYIVTWNIKNTTDSAPLQITGMVTAQSASGFTVSFNQVIDSANYTLEWQARGY